MEFRIRHAQELSAHLDPKKRKRINSIFSNFSRDIDNLIAHLRDEVFCVRSPKKSKGIFDLMLDPTLVALARSIAQQCIDMEQFSEDCFL